MVRTAHVPWASSRLMRCRWAPSEQDGRGGEGEGGGGRGRGRTGRRDFGKRTASLPGCPTRRQSPGRQGPSKGVETPLLLNRDTTHIMQNAPPQPLLSAPSSISASTLLCTGPHRLSPELPPPPPTETLAPRMLALCSSGLHLTWGRSSGEQAGGGPPWRCRCGHFGDT